RPDEQEYIAYRTFFIEGTAKDGTPVHGAFSLMVPGKVERGKSKKVLDEAMKERIVAAMKLLGRGPGDTVSEEEMQELEAQGRLPHSEPPDDTGDPPPEEDRSLMSDPSKQPDKP